MKADPWVHRYTVTRTYLYPMKLNQTMIKALIAQAAAAECQIFLDITSQGVMLKLSKASSPPGDAGLSKCTQASRWIDRNNPEIGHAIERTFREVQ